MDNISVITLHEIISSRIEDIKVIWDDLGLSSERQNEEIKDMMVCIEHLVSCFMKQRLELFADDRQARLKEAKTFGKKAMDLVRVLDLPDIEPEENLKIIQLVNYLKDKVAEMDEIYKERSSKLNVLSKQEQILAKQLGETPVKIPTILSQKTFADLERHIEALNTEKKNRLEMFGEKKELMTRQMNQLERVPDTTLEHDFVCEDLSDFQLTKVNLNAVTAITEELRKQICKNEDEAKILRDNLELLWSALQTDLNFQKIFLERHDGHKPSSLKALRDEVDRCRALKMQHAEVYLQKVRQEIYYLWDRCYVSLQDRKAFEQLNTGPITEEVVEVNENELMKLKDLFSKGEELFTKFKRRMDLWNRMIKFEKPDKDQCRFKNRGGRLLQEEKERKKLMIMIPKIESELEKLVIKWDLENPCSIYVYGKKIMDFIRDQWDEYQEEKENEKQKRHEEKVKQLEDEAVTGSKDNLSKRRLMCTPNREPLRKLPKMTTMSCSVAMTANRTIFSSRKPPRPATTISACKSTNLPRRLGVRRMHKQREPKAMSSGLNDTILFGHAEEPIAAGSFSSTLTSNTHFEKNLIDKCNADEHCRSSVHVPPPRSPSTPRRYRDKLGLPFLL